MGSTACRPKHTLDADNCKCCAVLGLDLLSFRNCAKVLWYSDHFKWVVHGFSASHQVAINISEMESISVNYHDGINVGHMTGCSHDFLGLSMIANSGTSPRLSCHDFGRRLVWLPLIPDGTIKEDGTCGRNASSYCRTIASSLYSTYVWQSHCIWHDMRTHAKFTARLRN